MLELTIPGGEFWDEDKEEFIRRNNTTIRLEHSLVSLSKWESKWHKPFLSKKSTKTPEEITDYVRFMTISQNVDPSVYSYLTAENYRQINEYLDDPMTATWFNEERKKSRSSQQITSELIYYWMIESGVPFDPCQKWHLNRLLTLIKVCSVERQSHKKKSKKTIFSENTALNAARRARLNSNG